MDLCDIKIMYVPVTHDKIAGVQKYRKKLTVCNVNNACRRYINWTDHKQNTQPLQP